MFNDKILESLITLDVKRKIQARVIMIRFFVGIGYTEAEAIKHSIDILSKYI